MDGANQLTGAERADREKCISAEESDFYGIESSSNKVERRVSDIMKTAKRRKNMQPALMNELVLLQFILCFIDEFTERVRSKGLDNLN